MRAVRAGLGVRAVRAIRAARILLGFALAAALVADGGEAVARSTAPRPAARWSWPVPPPHTVVRPFVAPATPYAAGHRGIDVAEPVGTPVIAPDDGIVRFAGRLVDRGVVAIAHAGGVASSFEPVDPAVVRGQAVHRGEVVGVVATGGARRPGTLYIGARIDGGYVSPLLLLGGLQRAVLLPER